MHGSCARSSLTAREERREERALYDPPRSVHFDPFDIREENHISSRATFTSDFTISSSYVIPILQLHAGTETFDFSRCGVSHSNEEGGEGFQNNTNILSLFLHMRHIFLYIYTLVK